MRLKKYKLSFDIWGLILFLNIINPLWEMEMAIKEITTKGMTSKLNLPVCEYAAEIGLDYVTNDNSMRRLFLRRL